MNPKYERFIKKPTSRRRSVIDTDDELPGLESPKKQTFVYDPQAATGPAEEEGEPRSFYEIYRSCGNDKWLQQDQPAAKANFNVFNLTTHPERERASGLAVIVVKGTSFPDKREACVQEAAALAAGESTGEVELRPEPENIYDPDALGVYSIHSGKHLGYIPKAAGANKHYVGAIAAGRLTGAYLIEAKQSKFKGEPSALLFVATGWKTQAQDK